MQRDRSGLELRPVTTTTTSFVEHSLCVLPVVTDMEVSFRIEGFIPSPGETVGCSCHPTLRTASAEESCQAPDYTPLTAPGVKVQPPPPNLGQLRRALSALMPPHRSALWPPLHSAQSHFLLLSSTCFEKESTP